MRLGGGLLAVVCCALAPAPAWAQDAALTVSGPATAPYHGDAFTVTLSGTVPNGEDPARLASRTQAAGPCAPEPGDAGAATVANPGDFTRQSRQQGRPAGSHTVCAWLTGASGTVIATASVPVTVRASTLTISAPASIQQEWVMPGLPGGPVHTPRFQYTLRFETGPDRSLRWLEVADGQACPPHSWARGRLTVSGSGQRVVDSLRTPPEARGMLLCAYVGDRSAAEVGAQANVAVLPPPGPRPRARVSILSLRRDGRTAVGWADCHCQFIALDARRSDGLRASASHWISTRHTAGVRRPRLRLAPGRWVVQARLLAQGGRQVIARSARRSVRVR